MSNTNIVRAWKDAEYRQSLSAEERASIPNNPAGLIELTDDEVGLVAGGLRAQMTCTVNGEICCCDSVRICY
jgi:mersacidin/lichenicidin family type 2 lantibiotic